MLSTAALRSPSVQWAGPLLLFAGVLCISFAALFVQVSGLPPTAAGLHRMGTASVLLILWAMGSGARPAAVAPPRGVARLAVTLLILAGVAFAFDMAMWNRSILAIGPGMATLIANLQIFLVPVIAGVLGAGWPRRRFWMAALAALFGLALLAVPLGTLDSGLDPTGLMLGLGAAALYSVYIAFLGESSRRWALGPTLTLLVVCSAGALTLGTIQVAELVLDPAASVLARTPSAWLGVAGMSLVCQLGGWGLLLRGIQRVGAAAAGVALVGQSVLATVWDVVLLGRQLSPQELIGGAIVLVSIAAAFSAARTQR